MNRQRLTVKFAQIAEIDRLTTKYIKSHANLIVAATIVVILIRLHTSWLLASLLFTGLFSYFLGISSGLLVSLACTAVNFYLWMRHGFPDSSHLVLDTVAYWCNVWLACQYRHEVNYQQRRRPDQVITWMVANDIRNSLAAVRFVLFPWQERDAGSCGAAEDIRRVSEEIKKIEQFFKEMEQKTEKEKSIS